MEELPLKGSNSCVTSTEKAKANVMWDDCHGEDFYPAFLLLGLFLLLGSWLNDAAN